MRLYTSYYYYILEDYSKIYIVCTRSICVFESVWKNNVNIISLYICKLFLYIIYYNSILSIHIFYHLKL